MNSRQRTSLRYAISVVLTTVFLYLAFRGTDFVKLYEALLSANYWWMIPSFVCLIVSHLLRSWRWRYMLEPVKPNIGFRNLFSAVMVGYFLNNILPRAGELGRPYTIGKLESIPKSAAFGTVVVERIIDTASFVVLVLLIPFIYEGPLRESFPWLERAGMIVTVGTGAVMVVMVGLMIRRDWTDVLLRLVARFLPERMAGRLEGMAHSFLDGLLFLKRPGRFAIILVLSILIWVLYILMVYVAFFAFGIQNQLGFAGAIVVQAISSIGVAIPTPGSTGSYHAFTSQTLIKLFAIDPTVALSYATVTHAAGFVGVTLIGIYYFLKDNITVAEAVGKEEETGP